MAQRISFSQKAIDNLSNGSDTHLLTSVKATWSWLLLTISILLFLALLFWGCFGRIAQSLSCNGITLLSDGVRPVISYGEGTLKYLNIVAGAKVKSGQALGQLYNPKTIAELGAIKLDFDRLRTEVADLEASYHNKLQTNSMQSSELDKKIHELKLELAKKHREFRLAKKLFAETFWVHSDSDGTVIEVFKEQGSFVKTGEKIALVAASPDDGIYLVAYVPLKDGKKIRTGMRAFFSPSNAPSAKYGYIKAVVRDVSSAPVNFETVESELLNSSLARLLVGNQAMTRVVLELIPDSNSISGYSWTGKRGHAEKLINGVFGEVIINTEYCTPLAYITQAMEEFFYSDYDAQKLE